MILNRILILAGTARAINADREHKSLPAIQRYDGPAFRTLRLYLREAPLMGAANLGVLVISARFGVIDSSQEIAGSDCDMTDERAENLAKHRGALRTIATAGRAASAAMFVGGAMHRNCVMELWAKATKMQRLPPLHLAQGGIGDQIGSLKTWLESGTLGPRERADAIQAEIGRIEGDPGNGDPSRLDALYAELSRLVRTPELSD